MRRFTWEPGEVLDPTEYQKWLAVHGGDLPPGARVFVSHASHFDYHAYRVGAELLKPGTPLCPKDLLLQRVSWSGERNRLVLELMFPGYDRDAIGTFDLTIAYRDVVRFHLDQHRGAPNRSPIQLGGLMADEVASGDDGVVHYLDFECGSVTIVGADFVGTWR